MVTFHSSVKLPDGTIWNITQSGRTQKVEATLIILQLLSRALICPVGAEW